MPAKRVQPKKSISIRGFAASEGQTRFGWWGVGYQKSVRQISFVVLNIRINELRVANTTIASVLAAKARPSVYPAL